MQRSALSLTIGLAIVAGMASPAWAQRGRHGGTVSTPYGTFSAAEMAAGGGNPEMAAQLRQQKQYLQYEQQAYKQQQAYQQQVKQQQAKQAEFLKKHPEAAKALNAPARTTTTAKRGTRKADKKKATDDTAATKASDGTTATAKTAN